MKLASSTRARRPVIDMVPMINFAFLLLIFFVLAGHAGQRDAAREQLAHAQQAQAAPAAAAGELRIAADGALVWDGAAVSATDLLTHAQQWRAQHAVTPLRVTAPAGTPALRVVEILQALRAAQIENVTLAVRA